MATQRLNDNESSKRLAGLVGPTMLAIGASEALTYQIWSDNTAPLIALNGVLLFIGGLAIVRAHNRWAGGWPVLLTIVGWLGIFAGLFRMFFPQVQQRGENTPTTVASAILVGVVGLVLTYFGYRREQDTMTVRQGSQHAPEP